MLLEPTADSPALAREYTDGVLADKQCDPATIGDARLVVSELVTNAVLHARTPIEVQVLVGAATLRIEVTDSGLDRPHMWAERDRGGRGLPIVEAIASGWGVVDHGSRKTVWCEIALRPRASTAADS
jgi:anti-sigma regulatory factor (Ser/Thr protein kinase)